MIRISFWRWIGRRVFAFIKDFETRSVLLYQIPANKWIWCNSRLISGQMTEFGVHLITDVCFFTGAVSSWVTAYQFLGVKAGGCHPVSQALG